MQGLEKLEELANKLPATVKDNALALVKKMGEVIEGIGEKPLEWKPGNLKVVQATTDRSKLPKGTAIGSLVVGEKIKDQPLSVIPLKLWTTRQKWSPDRENNRLECWSPDSKVGFTLARECKGCPHEKFNQDTNRSDCNKTKTVWLIDADLSSIFTASFSKTGYQNGMAFEGLLRDAGVAPFKRKYTLKTGPHPKYKNVEAITVTGTTEVLDPTVVDFLQELYNVMNSDREKSLALIYDLIKARREAQTNALPAPDDSTIPLDGVEDHDLGTDAAVVAAPAVTAGKAEKPGVKYLL